MFKNLVLLAAVANAEDFSVRYDDESLNKAIVEL